MDNLQIREYRKSARLTQLEFARLAGVTKGACAQWESGATTITAQALTLIRARVHLRQGREQQALDVLREAL